jgi:hypothetical protein
MSSYDPINWPKDLINLSSNFYAPDQQYAFSDKNSETIDINKGLSYLLNSIETPGSFIKEGLTINSLEESSKKLRFNYGTFVYDTTNSSTIDVNGAIVTSKNHNSNKSIISVSRIIDEPVQINSFEPSSGTTTAYIALPFKVRKAGAYSDPFYKDISNIPSPYFYLSGDYNKSAAYSIEESWLSNNIIQSSAQNASIYLYKGTNVLLTAYPDVSVEWASESGITYTVTSIYNNKITLNATLDGADTRLFSLLRNSVKTYRIVGIDPSDKKIVYLDKNYTESVNTTLKILSKDAVLPISGNRYDVVCIRKSVNGLQKDIYTFQDTDAAIVTKYTDYRYNVGYELIVVEGAVVSPDSPTKEELNAIGYYGIPLAVAQVEPSGVVTYSENKDWIKAFRDINKLYSNLIYDGDFSFKAGSNEYIDPSNSSLYGTTEWYYFAGTRSINQSGGLNSTGALNISDSVSGKKVAFRAQLKDLGLYSGDTVIFSLQAKTDATGLAKIQIALNSTDNNGGTDILVKDSSTLASNSGEYKYLTVSMSIPLNVSPSTYIYFWMSLSNTVSGSALFDNLCAFKIGSSNTYRPKIVTDHGNQFFGGNVNIQGNLTVKGTQTILDVETVQVEDSIIHVGKDNSSATDFGISVGSSVLTPLASVKYNVASAKWIIDKPLYLDTNTITAKSFMFGDAGTSGNLLTLISTSSSSKSLITVGANAEIQINNSGKFIASSGSTVDLSAAGSGLILATGQITGGFIDGLTIVSNLITVTKNITTDKNVTLTGTGTLTSASKIIANGGTQGKLYTNAATNRLEIEQSDQTSFKAIINLNSIATANKEYTFPNYNGTFVLEAAQQVLTNKTITDCAINGTTFSSYTINKGGNEAILSTSGLTGDRTYTFPNYNATLASSSDVSSSVSTHAALTSTHGVIGNIVGTSDGQILTNKTITDCTINGTSTTSFILNSLSSTSKLTIAKGNTSQSNNITVTFPDISNNYTTQQFILKDTGSKQLLNNIGISSVDITSGTAALSSITATSLIIDGNTITYIKDSNDPFGIPANKDSSFITQGYLSKYIIGDPSTTYGLLIPQTSSSSPSNPGATTGSGISIFNNTSTAYIVSGSSCTGLFTFVRHNTTTVDIDNSIKLDVTNSTITAKTLNVDTINAGGIGSSNTNLTIGQEILADPSFDAADGVNWALKAASNGSGSIANGNLTLSGAANQPTGFASYKTVNSFTMFSGETYNITGKLSQVKLSSVKVSIVLASNESTVLYESTVLNYMGSSEIAQPFSVDFLATATQQVKLILTHTNVGNSAGFARFRAVSCKKRCGVFASGRISASEVITPKLEVRGDNIVSEYPDKPTFVNTLANNINPLGQWNYHIVPATDCSIVDGSFRISTGPGAGWCGIYVPVRLTSGKTYKVSFTAKTEISNFGIRVGSTIGGGEYFSMAGFYNGAFEEHSGTFTATQTITAYFFIGVEPATEGARDVTIKDAGMWELSDIRAGDITCDDITCQDITYNNVNPIYTKVHAELLPSTGIDWDAGYHDSFVPFNGSASNTYTNCTTNGTCHFGDNYKCYFKPTSDGVIKIGFGDDYRAANDLVYLTAYLSLPTGNPDQADALAKRVAQSGQYVCGVNGNGKYVYFPLKTNVYYSIGYVIGDEDNFATHVIVDFYSPLTIYPSAPVISDEDNDVIAFW